MLADKEARKNCGERSKDLI